MVATYPMKARLPLINRGFSNSLYPPRSPRKGKAYPISNRASIALFLPSTPLSVLSVARNSLALPLRFYRRQLVRVFSKQGIVLPVSSSLIFYCPEPCPSLRYASTGQVLQEVLPSHYSSVGNALKTYTKTRFF